MLFEIGVVVEVFYLCLIGEVSVDFVMGVVVGDFVFEFGD